MSNLQAYTDRCQALREGKKTLLLSSIGQDGFPEISCAPYVKDNDGNFYIFITELASHTVNLRTTPKASVMFIADEQDTTQIFARERLIFPCNVVEMDSESGTTHQTIMGQMQAEFGTVFETLRSLPDFYLFQLKPLKGGYVVGFGKAYEVEPKTGELTHITEEKIKQR